MRNISNRQTNIELFRIVSMLMIVAHHYVVNSGITALYDDGNPTGNQLFLQIFGAFGKTGINCFTLISGYFLIDRVCSAKKAFLLWSEFFFWQLLLTGVFVCSGYQVFSIKGSVFFFLSPVFRTGRGYIETVIFLFMLLPFLNRMVSGIGRTLYLRLLAVLLFYFTIIPTFTWRNDTFNYLGWLCTIYLVGGYIKLFPNKITESLRFGIMSSTVSIALMVASILVLSSRFYMVPNANKLLPLVASVSMFIVAKNIRMRNNTLINLIASTCFGVLCIHINSDVMVRFLWKDVLNNASWFDSSWAPIHAVCSTVLVFAVCSGLSLFQKRTIGVWWNKLMEAVWRTIVTVCSRCEKFLEEFI